MYSRVKFFEKEKELLEIHFSMQLGGLNGASVPDENPNSSDFNEIKTILLMITGSQDLYRGVYTDLIIGY